MNFFRHDPRQPIKSFDLHMKFLKVCGLWTPDDGNKRMKYFYEIYSTFILTFWLYLFVISEVFYFRSVTNIQEFAEGLYFFLIEFVTIPKVYYWKKNMATVKNLLRKLECKTFASSNEDEDKHLSWAIIRTLFFHRLGIAMCFVAICQWTLILFIPNSKKNMLIPATFPFWNETNNIRFMIIFVYQALGSFFCAVIYWTMDTIMTGTFYHAAAQTKRLGAKLSKIGYVIEVKSIKKVSNYEEVVDCVKHHKEIIEYCETIQETFEIVSFIQLGISLFAICFTMFILMNSLDGNVLASLDVLPYFFGVSFQIFQVCFAGNELTYATRDLTNYAYSCNFIEFDVKTKRLMVTFMERLKRGIQIKARGIFRADLNISTFLGVMRAAYTYFAVLKSVNGK